MTDYNDRSSELPRIVCLCIYVYILNYTNRTYIYMYISYAHTGIRMYVCC